MIKAKFHVKRGDTVQVISGNHRGSSGRILQVLPEKAQVIIEGVRLIKKHQRKTHDNPNGAIISHRSLINHSWAIADKYGLGNEDRMLQSASIIFDVAGEPTEPTAALLPVENAM